MLKTKLLLRNKYYMNFRSMYIRDTNEILHLEQNFVSRWEVNTSECRSASTLNFWNVVIGKDCDNNFDRNIKWCVESRGKGTSYVQDEGRINGLVTSGLGTTFYNALIEGKLEGTGRWWTRPKQLRDDFQQKEGIQEIEKEVIDRLFKPFVSCILSTYGIKTNWCHYFSFIYTVKPA